MAARTSSKKPFHKFILRQTDNPTSPIRSLETGLLTVALVAAFAALQLLLAWKSSPGEWMLIDMRQWTVAFQPGTVGVEDAPIDLAGALAEVAPPITSQRMFRLPLILPTIPQKGDLLTARQTVGVKAGQTYCFEVLATSSYFRPKSPGALRSLTARAWVNGTASPVFRLASSRLPVLLSVPPVRAPSDGKLLLRLQLQSNSNQTRESWRRASRILFDYGRLRPCRRGSRR